MPLNATGEIGYKNARAKNRSSTRPIPLCAISVHGKLRGRILGGCTLRAVGAQAESLNVLSAGDAP
jgi:hypothetical protein